MGEIQSKPIWDTVRIKKFKPLSKSGRFDVVVIGGGITGLTAAYFLKQAGKKVCVLDRNRLGAGDTGVTTAHLTCVTDTRLSELVKVFDRDRAAMAWRGGMAALDTIERIVTANDIPCQFHRTPAFLHASLDGNDDEVDELKAEAGLARELGFDCEFVPNVPVVNKPGIQFSDQAKFHPRAYLAGLVKIIEGDGCAIHEESDVTEVEASPLVVVANGARIECDYLVIATHVPLQGKAGMAPAMLLQTKLAAYSTYVLSGQLPKGRVPDVSLWDTGNPYYYLRVDAGTRFDRAIFGGNDHKTGQESNTEDCYQRLQETMLRILPAVKIDHRWSGQVIGTNDGLPLIGESSPLQFVATGFNGNGITFGTLAGLMAHDAMLGRENPWQDVFAIDRKKIRGGTWKYVKENLDYPYYLAADRVGPTSRTDPASLKAGEGKILKFDGKKVACSRDEDGELHQVSAICTHLGCIVRWNDAERTWDCPCHGSRFQPTGAVLAGPAETPLEPIESAEKTHAQVSEDGGR